ncbi:hypothetical protein NBRC116493_23660 [Aurantivibrio infirmus]
MILSTVLSVTGNGDKRAEKMLSALTDKDNVRQKAIIEEENKHQDIEEYLPGLIFIIILLI